MLSERINDEEIGDCIERLNAMSSAASAWRRRLYFVRALASVIFNAFHGAVRDALRSKRRA